MSIRVDPVLAKVPLSLEAAPALRERLHELAHGRPLIIDYYASRYRGLTSGDLTAGFPAGPLQPRYVELEPIEGVRVLADRHLLDVLADGATLRLSGLPFARRITVTLPRPERWIEFLDHRPPPRG